MNIEALTQLKRVVEEAPEDQFNMSTFGTCGTAHCAAGWAALDEWFQKNTEINKGLNPFKRVDGTIVIDIYEADQTLIDVFDLNKEDANALFMLKGGWVHEEIPKSEVIENINRLLSGEDAVHYQAYQKIHGKKRLLNA